MLNQLLYWLWWKTYRQLDLDQLTALDYFLIPFNTLEAFVWLVCAAYVFQRNQRHQRTLLEFAYAGCFVLFSVTDVIEVFRLTAWLIWLKLIVLLSLFSLRKIVVRRYPHMRSWI